MADRRISGRRRRSSDRWLLVIALIATALLAALAVLQYHWTGQLSDAANRRMRANLEESSRLLANDIDGQLSELQLTLLRAATSSSPRQARGEERSALLADTLSRLLQDWRESAGFPAILDRTRIVFADRRSTRRVFRLDEESGQLQAETEPDVLEELDRLLRRPGSSAPAQRTDRLVMPIPARGRGGPPGPAGLIVATLRSTAIEEQMLPALIERHFGATADGAAPKYLVTVTDTTSSPPRLLYPLFGNRAEDGASASARPADIEFSAFRAVGRESRRRFGPGRSRGERAERSQPALGQGGGPWLVRITHRRGSLEAATSAARRRNLYHSSGALFLIGVAFALVLVSARRARALAAQQVDFVAGVSHELNTPLQAIRSAGENLRSGIVHRSDDVRGYGELIEREERRLSRLVQQALQWAGIGRSTARRATAEIDLGELLYTAVAESKWFLEENGVELELEGLDHLPLLRGDREGLITVFMNLLHNATKYGRGADGAVRVRIDASGDADGRGVAVAVTDRGPGIPKAEQRRIFDPFVRGLAATESGLPGSGLGLSLARNTIEEHGGSITVDSEPGRTTFRVVLPVQTP
ncbi:MAG: HAMP domain-containing histidine kinase [Holophagales bacterium]|nr:HAMP domain-containing histidine kinase [Holophagales bacterium]MYD21141.1 HAMP domain-containing histidine kinase [Holophagales bacterium]MYI32144.1 HAMP domain-containing histidine kinase [Holophagales bacterium]